MISDDSAANLYLPQQYEDLSEVCPVRLASYGRCGDTNKKNRSGWPRPRYAVMEPSDGAMSMTVLRHICEKVLLGYGREDALGPGTGELTSVSQGLLLGSTDAFHYAGPVAARRIWATRQHDSSPGTTPQPTPPKAPEPASPPTPAP